MIQPNTVVKGVVQYAVLAESDKGVKQLEIGFSAREMLLGNKESDGVERVPEVEGVLWLHLDGGEDEEKAKKRRNIARAQIEAISGVHLKDEWTDDGYLRLVPDHPASVIPLIVGKEVLFKSRDFNDKTYWDIYYRRPAPKAMSLDELKKKLAVPF